VVRPLLVGDLLEGSRHRGETATAARCHTCGLRLGSRVFRDGGERPAKAGGGGVAAAVEREHEGIGEGILAA
jgi:hypothetical protein